MAEWTADSNEATRLSLVGLSGEAQEFHPTFTYPIFGEEEKIYGYKDLSIDIRFACGSLTQFVSVSWAEKLASKSTVDDVEGTLKEFIPEDYLRDADVFSVKAEEEARAFRPLGRQVNSYTRKGKAPEDEAFYEVYHATWETPGFREYHQRMQLFILLYIEAGSYINDEDDQWEFFVLYEKRRAKDSEDWIYHFMGYSSLYNFYYFPDKTRLRLSQFVILPPFQRGGHGSSLYSAIYQYILSKPEIAELTVEDPAEAFEDLRDKNDLIMLFNHQKFLSEGFAAGGSSDGGRVGGIGKTGRSGRGGLTSTQGRLGPPVDKHWAERMRLEMKIASRQFQRLIEMVVLSRLESDARAQKAYRLQVKERLYRFNFEMLAQLEPQERQEKLEETFKSVTEDYRRILALVN